MGELRKAIRFVSIIVLALSLIVVPSAMVYADWQEGTPSKWVQLPDLNTTGIDVLCDMNSYGLQLADDFRCNETGPITDIHIWGSWRGDIPDLNATFVLEIWSDIPADHNGGYSEPNATLWSHTFSSQEYVAIPSVL